MSFRISASATGLAAQRYLGRAQRATEKSQLALASGSRVVNAGDDAAGFAIAESLRGQLKGTRQAKFNAENAVSLVQTAEGGLNEQNNILVRLRELAVYSASDTIGDQEREYLNKEFQELSEELDRIAKTTNFGNKPLLTGTGEEFTFQVGAFKGPENTIKFKLDANTTSGNLGISGLDILDQDDAIDTLEYIDTAINQVGGARATFGAMQSRFQHAIGHLEVQADNLDIARSNIIDVDVAKEVSSMVQNQILQEAGIAVLSQVQQDARRVINLI